MDKKSNQKNKKEKIMDVSSMEVGEDATKYGEFISSFFEWNTLTRQKETAEKLENITGNDNKKKLQKNRKKILTFFNINIIIFPCYIICRL